MRYRELNPNWVATLVCPEPDCHSERYIKNGDEKDNQRYICKGCGSNYSESTAIKIFKPTCPNPKCKSDAVAPNGNVGGSKRFTCKLCGRNFSKRKKRILITPELKTRIMLEYERLIAKDNSISARQLEVLFGVNHVSISGWIRSHKKARESMAQKRKERLNGRPDLS